MSQERGIWSVMVERVSEQGRRWEGGREYKLDAYVLDMMANKKWVLVRMSTGGPRCLNLMKIGWA